MGSWLTLQAHSPSPPSPISSEISPLTLMQTGVLATGVVCEAEAVRGVGERIVLDDFCGTYRGRSHQQSRGGSLGGVRKG